jgi:hypothetical protein
MEKLVFIAGQLNVELQFQESAVQSGNKKIITDPAITLGGRAFRQAVFSKELDMNVILLGRIGDDYHGKMIRESLEKAGISTQYIKEAPNETTGMSIEINSRTHPKESYFHPGANMGQDEFKMPIDYYLHLCDAVIVNRWSHFNLRSRVLQAAQMNSVPNIYVRSGIPVPEEKNLPIDYLFLDFSEEDSPIIATFNMKDYSIQKGIFIYQKGEFIALAPTGEERYRSKIPSELNADFIVTRIMVTLKSQIKLPETIAFMKLLS